MPTTRVNGINIHYQEAGAGDPLVLLMGWGGDHTAWALQAQAFSPGFRCISPDNRGAGRSDQPDTPYTIRTMADDTVGLLDALGIDRAHVAGLSMGGMIAQEMAITSPGRVRTLQLHATLARVDPFLRAVGQSLLHARAALGREEYVRLLLTWVLSPRTYAEHADNVEMMVRIMVDHPYPASLAGLTRQAEACWAHDTLERLDQIRCPTLITAGADDIFVPPRFSQELNARIPGAELSVIEGGGHGYLWEQAPAFNDACLQFLRKHS